VYRQCLREANEKSVTEGHVYCSPNDELREPLNKKHGHVAPLICDFRMEGSVSLGGTRGLPRLVDLKLQVPSKIPPGDIFGWRNPFPSTKSLRVSLCRVPNSPEPIKHRQFAVDDVDEKTTYSIKGGAGFLYYWAAV